MARLFGSGPVMMRPGTNGAGGRTVDVHSIRDRFHWEHVFVIARPENLSSRQGAPSCRFATPTSRRRGHPASKPARVTTRQLANTIDLQQFANYPLRRTFARLRVMGGIFL